MLSYCPTKHMYTCTEKLCEQLACAKRKHKTRKVYKYSIDSQLTIEYYRLYDFSITSTYM